MYATLDDLLERFNRAARPELTELAPDPDDPSEPDEARLEQALTEASGQMDLYLGTRHRLPLEGLSDAQAGDLTRLCCDIARYRLWADQASKEVRLRYDDAIGFLEQAAAGRVRLGVSDTVANARASVSGAPRQLTRSSLSGVF
jgi:phage gp36-like protein